MGGVVIAIVGPTASGKSDLAVKIARASGGEVISADSRQVYTGLDIGSGKIMQREMRGVPHHMLNIASPAHTYTVAQYQKRARRVLERLLREGKTAVICGGTGQYVDAILRDISFPEVKPDRELRAGLEKVSTPKLFSRLKKLDPARARTIDRHNRRRLVRALEIALHIGASPKQGGKKYMYPTFFIGINPPQKILHKKIYDRLLKRIRGGMLAEVHRLHEQGLSWRRLEQLGLEYRYAARHLQGKLSKQGMIDQLYSEIKKYAKRQMTWFKRNEDIHWVFEQG
ncbi:tRNA (adenosine(37)-N6)-dimethylallyltransferase MiaA [Candidatus Wolfebacteria bacterium RIFCSPHIGHO2_01_FULL_48_22]|uniref:tRNA dimethylallyltransferase n=2 Tax=Candidatus Wolfeibacteriota TaxID=1752735 RepID=A0A1F8DS41_9BACT|nr:MAG: tRNA (adenosine(37)-N6)-dimethylallyltransferase MiaA [Candidatus Wolfebacteria bacterium RIFCSPHIGHO2_01_FULL_48_22]OGM92228.1 MAG: tRNA (adenosine(37)-N6)-dimethylallyltransferase MiaA [Candidatus Wolfebacteria bacterium RIFCSPLOWO2_01_FULL_47_17b]